MVVVRKSIVFTVRGVSNYQEEEASIFSPDEVEKIDNARIVIEGFSTNLFRMDKVNGAYRELVSSISSMEQRSTLSRSEIERKYDSFLYDWKKVLDYWATYTSCICLSDNSRRDEDTRVKRFESAFDAYYKDLTRTAFDYSREYTIASILRNSSTHVGDVVARIDYENKKIFACRDKILNDHSLTKVKREILLQQPAYFDLMKVADRSLETLRNVHNSLMNFVINADTAAALSYMQQVKRKIDSSGISATGWAVKYDGELELYDIEKGIRPISELEEEDDNYRPIDDRTGKIREVYTIGRRTELKGLNWKLYEGLASTFRKLVISENWRDIRLRYLGKEWMQEENIQSFL